MRYAVCAEPGCGRPGHRGWSRWCSAHMSKAARYGAPRARPVRAAELAYHRPMIARALGRYWDSKAVQAALREANDLLDYVPSHGFTVQARIRSQMGRLRAAGVEPGELLQRVSEVVALEYLDDRFRSLREANFALAREILKLRSMRTFRPDSTLLNWLGGLIRERLAAFCLALLR